MTVEKLIDAAIDLGFEVRREKTGAITLRLVPSINEFTEYTAKRNKNIADEKGREGLCKYGKCPERALEGYVHCEKHRDENRERARNNYEKMKQRGK